MNTEKTSKKDLYYTNDFEWIDFQGTVAYVGVCNSKLSMLKEIQQIQVHEPPGIMKRGEVIATIKYNEYQVEAHMPVDGKVLKMNDELISGKPGDLLQHAESSGWIALIVPSQPYERKDLLPSKEYRMNNKSKYAK